MGIIVQPENFEKHIRVLTEDIGVRLAGSGNDRKTVEYLLATFEEMDVRASAETFPVNERHVEEQTLDVRVGGQWRNFPCSLFSSTPGTDGRRIEAPLCFFEAPAEINAKDLSRLRGKAVVHLGCHIESRETYKALMEAKPAFMLFVDVRYPGTLPLADGLFPSYTKAIGAVPTVNVAFMDAWEWKAHGADAARLCVRGGMRRSSTANVIAELPGRDPDGMILYATGHHDTQADSVGADDNATGTAAVLEMARVLRDVERRHAIRLVAFGAEEQLSEGSAFHVRRHREELRQRGAAAFNFDGFGSIMGWSELTWNGPGELAEAMVRAFEEHGMPLRLVPEVVPYLDLFPFAAAGVPGVSLWRNNCAAGRFFHHRPDDNLSRISIPLCARQVAASAHVIADLAARPGVPVPRAIPDRLRSEIARFWEDLFGGWNLEG
jgi:Iap family predicted aminopeptidase